MSYFVVVDKSGMVFGTYGRLSDSLAIDQVTKAKEEDGLLLAIIVLGYRPAIGTMVGDDYGMDESMDKTHYWLRVPYTAGNIIEVYQPQEKGEPEGDCCLGLCGIVMTSDTSDRSWIVEYNHDVIHSGIGEAPSLTVCLQLAEQHG